MRWRFRNAAAQAENTQRAHVEAAIDRWWREFASNIGRLDALFRRQAAWDLPAWMAECYNSIQPGLFWEYGPGLNGGHRLVMTPEINRHLRPLVDEIVRRAPGLDGWEFYGYRVPESVDMAIQRAEVRGSGARIKG